MFPHPNTIPQAGEWKNQLREIAMLDYASPPPAERAPDSLIRYLICMVSITSIIQLAVYFSQIIREFAPFGVALCVTFLMFPYIITTLIIIAIRYDRSWRQWHTRPTKILLTTACVIAPLSYIFSSILYLFYPNPEIFVGAGPFSIILQLSTLLYTFITISQKRPER